MAVLARRVTVGTTATRLDASTDTNYAQSSVLIRCPLAAMWVGSPAVTTSTGFALAAGEWLEWDVTGYDAIYGVVASATAECQVLEKNRELA